MKGITGHKGYLHGLIGLLLFIPLFFSACEDQRIQTVTRTEYEPVYMTEQEFQNAVQLEEPRQLEKPGKIYLYNGYLFVNEINKGVHIIDNRDPSSPSKIGFVNIPANKDIAVKGDRLYADSHSDLVVFDISDMQNAELIVRKEGVFEFSASKHPGYPYQPADPEKGIVVDWKKVEVEETCQGDCYNGHRGIFFDSQTGALSEAGSPSSGGIGGSMARFAITGDYLYAVDDQSLFAFDISSSDPTKVSKNDIGWSIETIFPYEQNLFIGSASAMYIYDISSPGFPEQLSIFPHFTACDPVVAEGDFAYVTLRNSERCPQGVNRLEVIDIQDLVSPQKVNTYQMLNPHGLGIDNGDLFVGEGDKGLRILDATDPANIKQIRHISDIKAMDVIPFDHVLMVTGKDGIVQYDYSDINNLELLSTIPVVKE
ncbi:LVIVD repeat-containing protein [Fodinibius salsisoli]|uniref:LVIVD repeat-containing protein n=1 Tax=Fodinibius salsisoli TaxID=2820877 RepID=A0ABT3PJJ2_9BACT|nr:hypothetical protein [Fodinibius salsisoli]MCW9706115.1 hypothetical protein [Fodinibius salsisoli]